MHWCTLGRVEKSKNGINAYGYCFLFGFWHVETRKILFLVFNIFLLGGIHFENWPNRKITLFLWQSKTLLKYFMNLKEKVFLERGDQELSIGGLISFLPFRLVGWNFTWKLTIFTVDNAKFVKTRKKCKMAETPLSSGQNAFPRSFFLGFGGVFVLKSVFGFLIRAPEVPFLVPLKSWNQPKIGLVLAFQGYQKWYFRCPKQKSVNTFQY